MKSEEEGKGGRISRCLNVVRPWKSDSGHFRSQLPWMLQIHILPWDTSCYNLFNRINRATIQLLSDTQGKKRFEGW